MSCRRARLPAALSGRSLVELLVALTIGLIVLSAALVTVTSAGGSARHQDAAARLADDGQTALGLMTGALRMAGYARPRRIAAPGHAAADHVGPPVRGCDHGFASTTAANVDLLACAAGTSGPAAFAVLYEVDTASSWPGSAGQPTDCLGSQIDDAPSAFGGRYTLAEQRFFVRVNSGTGNPSLYCAGSGGTGYASQPLVDNVEQLDVQWGLAEAGTDPSGAALSDVQVVRYVSAATLEAEYADDPRRWSRVAAVRLCVLMRSAAGVTDAPAAHVDCQGASVWPADAGDRRLRRAYVTTVQLRNRGLS